MHLHPDDAASRLGFDAVRARLAAHARTVYGAEALAALAPSADLSEVEARLARAGQMQDLLGFDDPLPLGGVPEVRPTLRLLAPRDSRADAEALADVGAVLAALRRLHDYLHARREKYPALWAVGRHIVVLGALERRLAETIDGQGRVRDDASPELLRLARALAERQARLRETLLRALRDAIAHGYATEEQPTVRGGRAVIPVRAEARRKVEGFVHDVSASGQTVYVEPASVLELNNEIRELEGQRRREVERILREVSAHVRHHRADLEAGLGALARLDAAAAAGRLGLELRALVPETGVGGPLRLVRARNPVLALHVRAEAEARRASGEADVAEREVVPLDLTLGEDFSTLVITGPNAGGKSVAMKTAGVLALMTACGLPVPAAPGTRIPLYTRLFVDLGDRQSIQDDLSTFTSHLVNVRHALAEADARALVLMDEAGTGTDPAEGGALAEAVLAELTARGVHTIATTHAGALKAFADATPGAANGSMAFDRDSLAPTYRFRAGVPGSSYAFEIATRVGLPEAVVAAARDKVGSGRLRLDELVARTEAAAAAAEAAAAEAAAARAEADALRQDYERRLAQLRASADERRAQALAQAEQILKDANAAVERTIREIREAEAEREATRAARARLDEARAAVARRQQNTARRRTRRRSPEPVAPPPEVPGPIAAGDQVRVEGTGSVGEVLEIGLREAVVAFGQLTSRIRTSRLTKVGGPRAQRVDVRAPAGGPADPLPAVRARTRMDVRGMRVEEALPLVERFVDDAVAAAVPSVEIVHGKGTGALRQAIHAALAARRDIATFEAAPWNQGGDGVTLVALR
ncbi:MAG: endonuclease MutS2 [Rubricoccaceae bacterium]